MEDLRFHTNLLTPKSVLLSTLPSSKKLVFVCSICVHTNMVRGPMLGYISVGVLKNNPANKWLLVLKTKGKILTFFFSKSYSSYKSISLSSLVCADTSSVFWKKKDVFNHFCINGVMSNYLIYHQITYQLRKKERKI